MQKINSQINGIMNNPLTKMGYDITSNTINTFVSNNKSTI